MGLVSITLCEPLLWGWWSRMHNHAFDPTDAKAEPTCMFLQRTKLQGTSNVMATGRPGNHQP